MSEYPDIFPKNFESDILPKEAKKFNRTVYRVMKSGVINRNEFISTFEEIQRKIIPPKKKIDLNDPSLYSTSCSEDRGDIEFVLKLMMKHNPRPIIVIGETDGECGPSQLTKERVLGKNDSHVDWWIFKDALPHNFFRKVDENEE